MGNNLNLSKLAIAIIVIIVTSIGHLSVTLARADTLSTDTNGNRFQVSQQPSKDGSSGPKTEDYLTSEITVVEKVPGDKSALQFKVVGSSIATPGGGSYKIPSYRPPTDKNPGIDKFLCLGFKNEKDAEMFLGNFIANRKKYRINIETANAMFVEDYQCTKDKNSLFGSGVYKNNYKSTRITTLEEPKKTVSMEDFLKKLQIQKTQEPNSLSPAMYTGDTKGQIPKEPVKHYQNNSHDNVTSEGSAQ